MVAGSYTSTLAIYRKLLLHVLPILVYVHTITAIDYEFDLEIYHFPIVILAILGTVMGLLLALRTNSNYARWWQESSEVRSEKSILH